MADYTPVSEIPKILGKLRATFRTGKTKSLEWRRQQLLNLARFAQDNAEALVECLRLDLGKPRQEVMMAEVGPVVERSVISAQKLDEWAKPEELEVADWQKPWKPKIEKHPKGVVLIIAPWNYPVILSLQPLYGAISAGCCAVIKPSEISSHYASFLAQNLNKYLDPDAYQVVLGAVPEITKVLELKWDHIFYTGNGRVARILSAAAAKHLTPMTLELGGKSPVIVDSTADIAIAAKRILWGKINNAGQICVAPDFVVVENSVASALVEAFKAQIKAFYPQGALSADYGRIVSEAHFTRLKNLLSLSKGTIAAGGKWDEEAGKRGFEPTIVTDLKEDDSLLQEEIFGPILPIVTVDDLDAAIDYINNRDHSLVLYAFSTSEENKKKILTNTTSGSVVFNDTFQQLAVNELPFGGVGESGHGRQVLKYSFENFIYERGVLDVPYEAEPFMTVRYPPYTAESLEFMSAAANAKIPDAI